MDETALIRQYLQNIGRKGGQKTSHAKAEAARENGKKGGRPKKIKQEQSQDQGGSK